MQTLDTQAPADPRAEADAVYARLAARVTPLDDPQGSEPAPSEAPRTAPLRDDKGQFLGKAQTEQPESPVAKPVQENDPKEATAREKALTALRRARTPQSIIDSLDDTALMQWGTELAAAQSNVDRLLRQKGKNQPETPTDPKADKASGTPEFGADLKELGYSKEELQALSAPIQELATQMASQAAVVRRTLADRARAELSDQFPRLKDPGEWAVVEAKALELFAQSADDDDGRDPFAAAEGFVRDAIRIVRPTYHASKPPSAMRNAGSPAPTSHADIAAAYKGMTAHDVVMRELGAGRSPAQARAIVEQLGLRND